MKQSYSSGAMETALMDAECARADLENLRQDVWAKVRPGSQQESTIFPRVMSSLRTLSLAVMIVLLAVVPLSRELPVPAIRNVRAEPADTGPIIVIHEYEPPKQKAQAVSPSSPAQPRKQTAQKRSAPKRAQAAQTPSAKPQPSAGTVPYDKVYSLIQTGQRALKNNSSVIKIQ